MKSNSSNSNVFNGEKILHSIKQDSVARRADPLKFFNQFLEDILKDNTIEEARQQWKIKVEHFPWYADDALYCLNEVISSPPDDIVERLYEHGWIKLYHEEDNSGEEEEYTKIEYLDWLRQIKEDFAKIYEEK